jgi:carbon-monoxide dehydrogenase small subunit
LAAVQSTVDSHPATGHLQGADGGAPEATDAHPVPGHDLPSSSAGRTGGHEVRADGDQLVEARINGDVVRFSAPDGSTLLTALREQLGLTAAKEGCAQGDCGSCIVLMNGEAVNSCLVVAAEADQQEITTLEGLAADGELHPLQREFTERWAFQCGYCTPGMVMSCFALLQVNPDPTEADVREAIEGNLCRCTNYRPIVEAVLAAAATLRTKAATSGQLE